MLHLPLSHMWYSLLYHNALLFCYLNRLLSIRPFLHTLSKNSNCYNVSSLHSLNSPLLHPSRNVFNRISDLKLKKPQFASWKANPTEGNLSSFHKARNKCISCSLDFFSQLFGHGSEGEKAILFYFSADLHQEREGCHLEERRGRCEDDGRTCGLAGSSILVPAQLE